MIVRILTEGQYNLSESHIDDLNRIDNMLVEVVEKNSQVEFEQLLHQMMELVRINGEKLPDDELLESDLVLPTPDLTIDEAKEYFSGEGILPG